MCLIVSSTENKAHHLYFRSLDNQSLIGNWKQERRIRYVPGKDLIKKETPIPEKTKFAGLHTLILHLSQAIELRVSLLDDKIS